MSVMSCSPGFRRAGNGLVARIGWAPSQAGQIPRRGLPHRLLASEACTAAASTAASPWLPSPPCVCRLFHVTRLHPASSRRRFAWEFQELTLIDKTQGSALSYRFTWGMPIRVPVVSHACWVVLAHHSEESDRL